ncbi:uncharacterized protein A4U43_C02F8040 [Asparagus officinalis]|uniref:Pentacotripeptide-repeat region of PRORP domain-containing protein n=1 Tax=Asparagus officinalis TaxID=4686 RepID=A0A5P1FGZ3_ASPOF|nr:uncharacterized protein A4U43_C02F8040 [Asparagus officinalis]
MIVSGLHPDVYTNTTLVHGFCKLGNLDMAINYFDEMSRRGLDPDCGAYTARIGADLCLGTSMPWDFYMDCPATRGNGNWNEALRLYGEMHAKGIQPDSCTYSLLFKQFGKDHEFHAVRCLEKDVLSS